MASVTRMGRGRFFSSAELLCAFLFPAAHDAANFSRGKNASSNFLVINSGLVALIRCISSICSFVRYTPDPFTSSGLGSPLLYKIEHGNICV